MSTLSAQPAERTKKRGNPIRVLGVVILLWLLAGCNGTGRPTEFSMIETPSAIRHFGGRPAHKQGNLAYYEVGAVRDNGEITKITDLDGGVMWSYPLGDEMFIPDLKGAAFTIDLDDQWSWWHPPTLIPHPAGGDVFWESLFHRAVLEFTFPETPYSGFTQISWFVTPRLRCRYEIQQSEQGREPGVLVPSYEALPNAQIWFEYIIYEDPLGALDLVKAGELGEDIVSHGIENEQEYIFSGDSNGTVVASDDERSGTMSTRPGQRAKLFVGVSVFMRTYQKGDRIRIGGSSLPTSVSDSDRCTFSFGRNSYYTMRPVGND